MPKKISFFRLVLKQKNDCSTIQVVERKILWPSYCSILHMRTDQRRLYLPKQRVCWQDGTRKSFPQESKTHIVQDILVINTGPITLATWCEHWLIEKIPDAEKYWRQKEKGMTGRDGWPHQLNGHEFKQTAGNGEGQGRLECLGSTWSQRVRHEWVTKWQQKMINRTGTTSLSSEPSQGNLKVELTSP